MHWRIRAAGILAGLGLAATQLAAQDQKRAVGVEVIPYAGYMMFGNYFDGPLGTSVGQQGGVIYGAQLGLALGKNLSLVGNVGRASGDIEVGIPFLGGLPIGSSTVWLYDAGLQLRLPLGGAAQSILPFVQVGAGGVHHALSSGPIETKATNLAANVALGADLGLSRGLAVRLMAKDYIGRFDFEEATGIPTEGDLSHNVALAVGFRIGF